MTTLIPREAYTKEELEKLYPKGLELQLVQVVCCFILRHGCQFSANCFLVVFSSYAMVIYSASISMTPAYTTSRRTHARLNAIPKRTNCPHGIHNIEYLLTVLYCLDRTSAL